MSLRIQLMGKKSCSQWVTIVWGEAGQWDRNCPWHLLEIGAPCHFSWAEHYILLSPWNIPVYREGNGTGLVDFQLLLGSAIWIPNKEICQGSDSVILACMEFCLCRLKSKLQVTALYSYVHRSRGLRDWLQEGKALCPLLWDSANSFFFFNIISDI